MRDLSLALVHHPVLDRQGGVVTTAITNLDLHDLARSGRTYGASAVFVVHPIEAQRRLAERVQEHWVLGSGKRRIPDRATAMDLLRVVASLEEAYQALGGRTAIQVWTTAATARHGAVITYAEARARLAAARSRCCSSSGRAGGSRARWWQGPTCASSPSGRRRRRGTTT